MSNFKLDSESKVDIIHFRSLDLVKLNTRGLIASIVSICYVTSFLIRPNR
jgi:hypothetical protein